MLPVNQDLSSNQTAEAVSNENDRSVDLFRRPRVSNLIPKETSYCVRVTNSLCA
jgi:hypothetical protein